ncbi:MAG: hypothetical protein Q9191_003678 [Dirinaria sp. TL-2023a]
MENKDEKFFDPAAPRNFHSKRAFLAWILGVWERKQSDDNSISISSSIIARIGSGGKPAAPERVGKKSSESWLPPPHKQRSWLQQRKKRQISIPFPQTLIRPSSDPKPEEQQDTNGETYFLAQNPTEVERLRYQHEVFKGCMGGDLVLAPFDLSQQRGLQIFDDATVDASNLRLRDLRSNMPVSNINNSKFFIGTDIMPSYFPSPPAPFVVLMYHDMTTPYPKSFRDRFDLVHQRPTLPDCETYSLRSAVGALTVLVKPGGGWIRLLEADNAGPGAVWSGYE